jgi:hypothetical protein
MSCSVYAYLVDWDELTKHWKSAGKTPRDKMHWFQQAAEDQESWLTQYWPKKWINSWNATVDAGLFYDDAREDLKPAVRTQIDKYWRPFIGTSSAHRANVRDLSKRDTEDGLFEITMSPATVKDFCARAKIAWLDSLEPLWEEHGVLAEEGFTHIGNFKAFKRYLSQWQKLLQTAARKQKGLVVSIV